MTQPIHDAADAFLTGGGIASAFAKDDPVGTTVTGTICEPRPEIKQQTDISSGAPLTWDNGDPRMQLVVTVQVDGLPITDEDDGRRRVYVKGSKSAGSKSLHDAVATAVRAVGARGLEIGGRLTVQYIGDEPSKTRGFNDRKLWAASYQAPPATAASEGFLGTAAPAPAPPVAAAPAPVVAPLPAAPAAPVAATPPPMTAEQAAAYQAWVAQQGQQQAG